jgi:tetratricopeptide (TPR) repeat protein
VFLGIVRSRIFEKLRPPELPFVDNPLIGWDFWTARMTAVKVIGKYFWLLLWPQHLSCDYSYNQIPKVTWHFSQWEDLKALIALVSIILVILIAIRNYRRNKALTFFILLFFGTFLPTSNLIVIIGSIMAERFMYLPSIGFAGCAVIATYAICRRIVPKPAADRPAELISSQSVAAVVLVLIVMAYCVRSYRRNPDWENDVKLWTQAAQVCPESFKTHKSLAYALYERDQNRNPPTFADIDEIIQEGEKARAVIDKYPLSPFYRASIVYLHLGAYYRIKGDLLVQTDPNAARSLYQKSIETLNYAVLSDQAFNADNRNKELARGRLSDQIPDIGNQEIYANLALGYMRLGQYQDALNAYFMTRHLAPGSTDAYLNIASLYLSANHPEEAAITLMEALLLDSNRKEALSALTDIYRQLDREGCAVVEPAGKPRLNADCAIVHNHLCSATLGLIQIFVEAKQFDVAAQMQKSALQSYRCPPEPFRNLIPNKSTTANAKP